MALRAWSVGWPIVVFQFVKSPKWRVGEETALNALGETGRAAGHLAQDGRGLVLDPAPGTERDHAAEAAEGWAQIKRDLAAETYAFYVLDEFTYPMKWGWVDVADVVATLRGRPGTQHVVITGRDAHPDLMEAPTWSPT